MLARSGGAQGAGLGAGWERGWGVGRYRDTCRAGRPGRESRASRAWTRRGRRQPGRGYRVGAVTLGNQHRGRGGVERKPGLGVGAGCGAGGNQEVWGGGSRRGGERGGHPGCIYSHWVWATPVQTVDNNKVQIERR